MTHAWQSLSTASMPCSSSAGMTSDVPLKAQTVIASGQIAAWNCYVAMFVMFYAIMPSHKQQLVSKQFYVCILCALMLLLIATISSPWLCIILKHNVLDVQQRCECTKSWHEQQQIRHCTCHDNLPGTACGLFGFMQAKYREYVCCMESSQSALTPMPLEDFCRIAGKGARGLPVFNT